jgi:ketopantoate reductase
MWLLHFTRIVIICCKAVTCSAMYATEKKTIREELQIFLADNGFKYITLIENSTQQSEMKMKMI